MAKIEAVIFDLFWVILTDSLSQIASRIQTSNPAGFAEIKELVRQASWGMIERDKSNRRIAEILGLDMAEYIRQVSDGEVRDGELLNYIKELRKNHKIGLLSNVSRGGIQRRFAPAELSEYFDAVVASGDEGVAKPDPSVYELTADRLGVRCDACVFTDDIPLYCEGAQAVGMQAIHYEDFESFKQQLDALLSRG
jgi:epoxide hydrolase-like predicted phosphatase